MFVSFRVLKSWAHPASPLQPTVPDDFPVYDSGGIHHNYRILSQWWTNLIVQEPRGRAGIPLSDSSGSYALDFPKVFFTTPYSVPPTGWSPHTYEVLGTLYFTTNYEVLMVPLSVFMCRLNPALSRAWSGIYRDCCPQWEQLAVSLKTLFDLSILCRRDNPHVRWHVVAPMNLWSSAVG